MRHRRADVTGTSVQAAGTDGGLASGPAVGYAGGRKGADPGRGKERSVAFWRSDDGQGLVEYALIISVIAIAVILAMVFVRGQLQNMFSDIGNNLT
jgi:pilus assembly protein Flp/PilA